MKKRGVKKLTLSRETLHRLEEPRLRKDVVGAGSRQQSVCVCPCPESISFCITGLCVSDGYTGCTACEM